MSEHTLSRNPERMTPYDADEIAELSIERDETETVQRYICARCGEKLEAHEKHPVVTQHEEDPTLVLFCGTGCRTGWIDEQGESQ